jgi:hypothetical protein
VKVVDQMDQAIEQQETALKEMAADDMREKWLQSMPGIGAYSAMDDPGRDRTLRHEARWPATPG